MNYSYNFTSTNRVTNSIGTVGETQDSIAPFNQETLPYLLERAQNGVPLTESLFHLLLTYFKFLLQLSLALIMMRFWYLRELEITSLQRRIYNDVVIDTLTQFSTSLSCLICRLFGIYVHAFTVQFILKKSVRK